MPVPTDGVTLEHRRRIIVMMEVTVGLVLLSLLGYSVIAGVVYSLFVKYKWFQHEHEWGYGIGRCGHDCSAEHQAAVSRGIAAFFWWFFLIPLFVGWLYLVAQRTAHWLVGSKDVIPPARVVDRKD